MALRLRHLLRWGQSQILDKITIQPPPHHHYQRSWLPSSSRAICAPRLDIQYDKVEIGTPLHRPEHGDVIQHPDTDFGVICCARLAVRVRNFMEADDCSEEVKLVRVVGATSFWLGKTDREPVEYTVTLEGEIMERGQSRRRFYRAQVCNDLRINRTIALKDWCEWKPDSKTLLSLQSQQHDGAIDNELKQSKDVVLPQLLSLLNSLMLKPFEVVIDDQSSLN